MEWADLARQVIRMSDPDGTAGKGKGDGSKGTSLFDKFNDLRGMLPSKAKKG